MVVGRGHFAGPGGGRGQGADCRVLAVATRVLGRGGFCRQEMNGGDGGESNPKTLRRGVGAVGSSRPNPNYCKPYIYWQCQLIIPGGHCHEN